VIKQRGGVEKVPDFLGIFVKNSALPLVFMGKNLSGNWSVKDPFDDTFGPSGC
jgi:hypothetical protein